MRKNLFIRFLEKKIATVFLKFFQCQCGVLDFFVKNFNAKLSLDSTLVTDFEGC